MFAEASWYGSLRGGVQLDKGMDAKYYDGGSRWGIKGANEISEGLSAVYNFEHKISTADAGQPGGRLAYVGLSGGFGKLTLGQIWSASYNHTGGIRDIGNWLSSSDTSGRVGSALSYAFSGDAFSLQFDAIMDGDKNTGKALDQWELGATVNIGDIGKVAFAHVRKEDVRTGTKTVTTTGTETVATGRKFVRVTKWTNTGNSANQWLYSPKKWSDGAKSTWAIKKAGTNNALDANGQFKEEFEAGTEMTVYVHPATVYVKLPNTDYDAAKKQLKDSVAGEVHGHPTPPTVIKGTIDDAPSKSVLVDPGLTFRHGVACDPITPPRDETKCAKTTMYQAQLQHNAVETGIFWFAPGHVEDEMETRTTTTETEVDTFDYGEKSSHMSASFEIGAVTLGLGHSTATSMDPTKTKKMRTNYIGVKGDIGDSGLNWRAWYRTKKDFSGAKSKPWGLGLGKDLGGGAWAYVEHSNDGKKGNDKSSSTVVGLGVNF